MKVLLLKNDEIEFARRMMTEGFLACKKDNAEKADDYVMLKRMLKKTKYKCIDKKEKKLYN